MKNENNTDWYADGLRFTCTQCGNCCSGPPGYVWFQPEELHAMAGFVGEEPAVFLLKYARKIGEDFSLTEVERDGKFDCVFLKADPATGKRGCSIYPVRPTQCKTWPFWSDNLRSKRAWNNVAQKTPCPGMSQGGRNAEGTGRLYPIEEIRIQRDATPHE